MSKNSVPQVEGIKQLSGGGSGGDTPANSNPGDWPKRLRGYHRALKRQVPWAIRLSKLSALQFTLAWTYGRDLTNLVVGDNPFLKLIRKQNPDDWAGKYIPVPLIFGKKDE